MKKVAVVMGSASDLPLAKEALKTLAAFDVPAVARVLGLLPVAEPIDRAEGGDEKDLDDEER